MELVRYPPASLEASRLARAADRPTNLIATLIFVSAAAAILVFLFFSERATARRIEAERAQMAAQLNATSARVHALSMELDSLTARANEPAPTFATPATNARVALPRGSYSVAKLPEPSKSMPATSHTAGAVVPEPARSTVVPASNLDYSADINQLNGSIATTHEQLVDLERRGARHYIEFKLDRSPAFREIGPLWVAIRKISAKRGYYDVSIIVNGHMLQKSHVNLFEPIWINTTDRAMQFQLVANIIDKNQISGYLSEPKSAKTN